MMCLLAIATEAQVLTSQTVRSIYDDATTQTNIPTDGNYKFVYSADFNGNAIQRQYIYKQWRSGRGQLKPVIRYDYSYDTDGLLLSRVTYRWHKGEWLCMGRHDYLLQGDCYTMEYSRWNAKREVYDTPCEKTVLALLPDQTVSDIYCYERSNNSAPYQLTEHYHSLVQPSLQDTFLTQQSR